MKSIALILATAVAIISSTAFAAELKFENVPNFFDKNPDQKPLGPCHGGMVVDKKGDIYVTTDTPRGIVVFSSEGKYLRALGPSRIHALEIREENGVEFIYAARPSDHEVMKLKMNGETVWVIGAPGEAGLYKDGAGFNPCAVTVAPDGSIFVADGYGSNHVLKFDANRRFVKAFGGMGSEEGKFMTCHGIAVDLRYDKPLLLVCNRNNDRVEHWDLDGKFIKVIQKDLRMPAAVHIRGDYAVFPELKGRVTVIDKSGGIVAQLGDNPVVPQRANYGLAPDKWTEGIFNSPHGASLDKDGNVLVAEWTQFGRIHKFTRVKN